MGALLTLRSGREAPRAQRSAMETRLLDRDTVNQWRIPPFQRPLRVNDKVRAFAEELKANGGIISGVITVGKIANDPIEYLVDGQHRMEGFRLSDLKECICDVRLVHFDGIADMADEFVAINTSLVKMRPDDVLRGLEGSVPGLARIRTACDFVGYDNLRRNEHTPIVSMSAVLRCWVGSRNETPSAGGSAKVSSATLARDLIDEECGHLIKFLSLAKAAWGRDPEYYRLWNVLNLTLCMWLYRQLVLSQERGTKRYVKINQEQFKRCLMSVSAQVEYVDWLGGRQLTDRDRVPAYNRLKKIFAARLGEESRDGRKILMPQPAWAAH